MKREMDDLISRQKVLEEINKTNASGGFADYSDYCDLFDFVDTMPSAPDVPDNNVGDMISRQAAIEAINQMKVYRPLDSDRYVISDCLNKIVNLPSAQQWIPVSERLPEVGKEVLVYAVGKIDGFIGDSVIAITDRMIFRLFPSSEGTEMWCSPWQYFLTDYEITHWMPLPSVERLDET